MQASIAYIDPAQAARWRDAVGGLLNVATIAEPQSNKKFSALRRRIYGHVIWSLFLSFSSSESRASKHG